MKHILRTGLVVSLFAGAEGCANDTDVGARHDVLKHECGDDQGVNFADISDGKLHALCDHQNLTASFPAQDLAALEQGTISIPLNVLYEGEREYCFRDDNEERHEITLYRRAGEELLRLVSTEECRTLTLAPGRYTVKVRHARPGVPGLAHNNLHTFPERAPSGTPRLVFATNELRNGVVTGAWPSLSSAVNDFGFRGNYTGTTFQDTRCEGNKVFPATSAHCLLEGTFDNVTFAGQNPVWNIDLSGSFKKVRMKGLLPNGGRGSQIALRGTFTGEPFTNELPVFLADRPRVSSTFVAMLQGVPLDGRVQLEPDYMDDQLASVSGGAVDSFVDVDDIALRGDLVFSGTDIKLPLFRSGAPVDLSRKVLRLDGSRLHDGDLVGQGMSVLMKGGTVENVRLAPPESGGKRPTNWQAPDLSFLSGVKPMILRNVSVFSEGATRGTGPTMGTLRVRTTLLDRFVMEHATIDIIDIGSESVVRDSSLADDVVQSFGISSSQLDGLSLTSSSFDQFTLDTVDFQRGDLQRARFFATTVFGGRFGREVNATGVDFSGSTWTNVAFSLTAPGATFTDAKLTNVRTFEPELSEAVMIRAQVTFGVPYAAALPLSAPRSNWTDAKFAGAILDQASFADANLTRITCSSCQALDAVFTGANMDHAVFGEDSTVLDRARFTKAFLGEAKLRGSARKAIFDDADLSAADLIGLKLDGSSASDALFCGAKMSGVTLTDANLFRGRLRTTSQACAQDADALGTVQSDARTTCPDGTKGPCSGTAWDVAPGDRCCKPGTGKPCDKTKGPGFTCLHPCDCMSSVCNNGKCG
jgi:uncharacterized protein YjbI with pentapeptide repeats